MSGKPPPYVPLEEEGYQPPDHAHPHVQGHPHGQQPGYPGQQGYPPPPQQGYAKHPGWVPPPQQGYPPPQQGYAPPPPHGYPPPAHGYPPPQPVMVINNQPPPAPAPSTVVVNTSTHVQKKGINHCLHCCISIFFFPWLLVWLCLCICE